MKAKFRSNYKTNSKTFNSSKSKNSFKTQSGLALIYKNWLSSYKISTNIYSSYIKNIRNISAIATTSNTHPMMKVIASLLIKSDIRECSMIEDTSDPLLFLCGKGSLGTGIPRNLHRGFQPSLTSKTRSRSFETACFVY